MTGADDWLGVVLGEIDPDVVELERDGTARVWELTTTFEHGFVEGALFITVQADEVVTIEVAAQIQDIDFDRVDERLGNSREFDWDVDIDEESDTAYWIIAMEVDRETFAFLTAAGLIAHLSSVLDDLVSEGLVCLTEVDVLDDEFSFDVERLEDLKRRDPNASLALALDLGNRARGYGDHARGAELDLCAAEILTELGSAIEAIVLADRAWVVLGRPIARSEVVTSYTWALSRVGRASEALSIVDSSLDVVDDPDRRAVLVGNRGAILASMGRRAEAVDWLHAAISDPLLGDAERRIHVDNLSQFGRQPSSTSLFYDEPEDVLVSADRRLNEVADELMRADYAEIPASRAAAEQVVSDLKAMWSQLGPSQRVRVLLLESQLLMLVDVPAARLLWQEASAIASSSGDQTLQDGAAVAGVVAGFLEPEHTHGQSSDPFESVLVRFNRVLAVVRPALLASESNVDPKLLDELLDIIEIVDVERFRFRDPGDRVRWATLMSKVYEFGLTFADGIDRPDVASDILERMRAQGLPVQFDGVDGDPSRLGEGRHLDAAIARLRELPGDVPVARPQVARASESSRGDGPSLAAVIDAVAGASAWWWSTQLLPGRLHWCVRSPSGTLWSGVVFCDAELRLLAEHFDRSIADCDAAESHVANGRLAKVDVALARVSAVVLPDCLRTALLEAARNGAPIKMIVAMSAGLGAVPLSLLPIGEGWRLVDGAATLVAPPTVLVLDRVRQPPPSLPRQVAVALGADARLGDLADLVGSAGLDVPPAAVMGSEFQVHLGTAGMVATPEATLANWRSQPEAVALYYGHVMSSRDDDPLGAALRLSDGRDGTARLTARALLAAEQAGMCHTVVLAGCSSLGIESAPTGEWWGVACGLLRQGSSYVIGSQRDVLHCRTNVAFVAELTNELRRATDAASVLRDVQLRWLHNWDRFRNDDLPPSAVVPDPFIWAAYSVVGMAGSPSS